MQGPGNVEGRSRPGCEAASHESTAHAPSHEKARPMAGLSVPPCGRNYSGWTSSACRPFWPWTTLKETFWPSCSDLKPVPWIERKWTKTSWPLSGVMKPKPLASLNYFTVPV